MSTRKQLDLTTRNVKSDVGLAVEKPGESAVIERARQCVAKQDYEGAIRILRELAKDPLVKNDVGVCLMRLGNVEEAAQLFRGLVYEPGAIWIRPNVSTNFRINCATALLLVGHPAGCLDTLVDMDPRQIPRIQQIQAAIRKWEQSLSWWARFNWWLGRVEPNPAVVPIDFPAGEFELIGPVE